MTQNEKKFENYEVVSKSLSGDLETTLQFTAEFDEDGKNRLCICGSGIVWARCPGNNGETRFCG